MKKAINTHFYLPNCKWVLMALIFYFNSFSQTKTKEIDSLKLALTSATDTSRVKILHDLCWNYRQEGMQQEALKYGSEAVELARKISFTNGLANALSYLGLTYQDEGNFASALNCFTEEENIYKTYNNKSLFAHNQKNIGNVYADKGNYPKAIEYYYKSLKLFEEINDKPGIATSYNNLGIVYCNERKFEKTLEYFNKALVINQSLNRKNGIVNCLGNIGNVYYFMHDFSKAIEFYFKAIKINEETGNKSGLSDNYGNIAAMYSDQSDSDFVKQGIDPKKRYELTMQYILKALRLNEELGSKYGITVNYINIGWANFQQKKYYDAEEYLLKGNKIAKENGYLEFVKESSEKLSTLYSQTNEHKKSLEYYKRFIEARDSLKNEDNTKQQTRLEMNYEFEKKEAATKLEQEKRDAVAAAESRKQKIIIYAVSSGLLLILALAIVILRSLRLNQKKNRIISMQKEAVERQKEIVEEKQKEILDSIHYAKRIQTALLPGNKFIERNLKGLKK
jgi:tetratricopeptide (TPR) repeat protein